MCTIFDSKAADENVVFVVSIGLLLLTWRFLAKFQVEFIAAQKCSERTNRKTKQKNCK